MATLVGMVLPFGSIGVVRPLLANASASPQTKSMAAGTGHSLRVRGDGAVYAWGSNYWGQLGNGTAYPVSDHSANAVQVAALSGVTAVAGGVYDSFALKADGTVWAWGNNIDGERGTDPQNPAWWVQSPLALQIPISGVTALAPGRYYFTLALKADGTVWAWGTNPDGEFGNGTTTASSVPVQASISGVTSVAAGGLHSVALKSDGTVWDWGGNYQGQLGNGTTTDRSVPVQVSISGVTSVAAGGTHSLALKSDGTVWAWGNNHSDQLGNGFSGADALGAHTLSTTPVQVVTTTGATLTGVTAIAAGEDFSLALQSNGTVWAWGDNYWGELGDGTTTTRPSAAQVVGLTGVTAIAGGSDHVLAVTSDGTLWSWGDNIDGQLGNGTTTNSTVPVRVLWTPGAPTSVSATPEDGAATVSWSPPASAGAGAISSYTVTSPGGQQATVSAPATNAIVTGLSPGTTYTFTVAATNLAGTGPSSAPSSAVTVVGPPGAPTGVSATAGNAQATVQWAAPPANGSPISQYVVTPYVGGNQGAPIPTASTTATFTVPGLVNGLSYQFTVAAQNGWGVGAASAQSIPVTPDVLQGPPGTPAASAGNGRASLQWAPPTPNGGTIQQYVVTAYPSTGGATLTATTSSVVPTYTLMGLTNGTTYTFTVAAQNTAGTGPPSQRSNAVTPSTTAGGDSGTIGNFQYAELQAQTTGQGGCGANADGEPQVVVSTSGTVIVGSERGLSKGSDVWRAPSGAGGLMAVACAPTYGGQPNAVAGTGAAGGDIAMAVGSSPISSGAYPMYVASLNGGSVSVAHSTDDGQTWINVPLQIGVPADDREWIAAFGASTSLLSFHDIGTGNIDELRSDDGGATYVQTSQAIPATDYRVKANQTGSLVIDRRTTAGVSAAPGGLPGFWAYQALVAPSAAGGSANNELFVAVSSNGGYNWALQPVTCSVSGTGLDHMFPSLSVDPSGSLWAAWSDDSSVYTAVSSDHGITWSCSGSVNGLSFGPAIEPAIVATSAGVDLAYYAKPATGNTWFVYFVQDFTGGAVGWGTPQQLVAVHTGSVCELGSGCPRDRQLYEDFGIDVDASGWAHIAYSHDAAMASCSADLGCQGTYTGYLIQDAGVQVGYHN